jgi:hypothetical protein
MDPDPAIFVIDLQDASKKLIFNKIFSAYYFLKVHLNHFSKIKSQKESQNRRNQGFSYYFCMMIEGSGPGGQKTCGSGGSGSGTLSPCFLKYGFKKFCFFELYRHLNGVVSQYGTD